MQKQLNNRVSQYSDGSLFPLQRRIYDPWKHLWGNYMWKLKLVIRIGDTISDTHFVMHFETGIMVYNTHAF